MRHRGDLNAAGAQLVTHGGDRLRAGTHILGDRRRRGCRRSGFCRRGRTVQEKETRAPVDVLQAAGCASGGDLVGCHDGIELVERDDHTQQTIAVARLAMNGDAYLIHALDVGPSAAEAWRGPASHRSTLLRLGAIGDGAAVIGKQRAFVGQAV
jgi:hypothetical protein